MLRMVDLAKKDSHPATHFLQALKRREFLLYRACKSAPLWTEFVHRNRHCAHKPTVWNGLVQDAALTLDQDERLQTLTSDENSFLVGDLKDSNTDDPLWNAIQTQLRERHLLPLGVTQYWVSRMAAWTKRLSVALELAFSFVRMHVLGANSGSCVQQILWVVMKDSKPLLDMKQMVSADCLPVFIWDTDEVSTPQKSLAE